MDKTPFAIESLQAQKAKSVLFPLLGLSLALSVSGALVAGFLLLAVGMYAALRQKKAPVFPSSPLFALVLIYVVWGVVCTLANGSASVRKAFSSQSAFLMLFIVVWLGEKRDVKNMITFFVAGSVIQGVWAVTQAASGVNFFPTSGGFSAPAFLEAWPSGLLHEIALRNGRAVGSRSHPLTLAEGLIPAFFVLWIGVSSFFKNEKPVSRKEIFLTGSALALVSAGLLLAQGRGVWIGLLAGSAVALIPARSKTKLIAAVAVALTLLMGLALSSPLRSRFLSAFTSHGVEQSDRESRSIRFGLWEKARVQGMENPVLGQGLRGVRLQLDESDFSDRRVWREVHNMFLQSWLERGFPGLVLFLVILFFCARSIWGLPHEYKWPVLGMFLALLTAGLTESWMKDKEIALIFWTVMGAVEWVRWRERA